MRLTHIKLAGFKTFVDPTAIPIPAQRTGIVGPNGCGKSNVIDAVRWVLGESSARQLRGESMQDVIFNGSGSRKPVARASVELRFDNTLGKAAGQWSQYAEIAVKRVLLRNGESSYYINNLHVRRRDVTDIFLGTGLGPRAYAIIEQGMISRIIEARPEELRVFLEEAAGISKYKERRRETELRLKDTRENLARVEDIRQELDKQLARLEAQAQVAQQYHTLQAQLSTAQNLLWLLKKREAAMQWERGRQQVERLINELEAETARLREAESQLETARADHYAAGDALHAAQGELYGANAEVAKLEQQLQHQRETRQRLAAQLAGWQSQQSQLMQQRQRAEENLAHWREELEKADERAVHCEERLTREREALPQAEEAFRVCQQRHAALQRELSQAEQAMQVEETHRTHARRAIEQLRARLARLEQEQAALPKPDADALAFAREEAAELAVKLEDAEARLHAAQARLPELEAAQREARQAAHAELQRTTRLEAQLHALEQLQSRLEHNQKLKAWLAKHQLEHLPRLWASLRIEPGWETALEAVLGGRLNAIVLDSLQPALGWLGDAPPAPVTVFDRNGGAAAEAEAAGEFVPLARHAAWQGSEQGSALLGDWLHGVYAAESQGEAWGLRERLPAGACLVCRDGHVLTRHSVTFFAPQSELHGVLARQAEIERLRAELEACREALGQRQAAATEREAESERAQGELLALRTAASDLQQAHHRTQMEVHKLETRQQQVTQRSQQVEKESQELAAEIEVEAEQAAEHEYNLEQHRARIEMLAAQFEDDGRERAEAEARLAKQRQSAHAMEREAQDAGFHRKHCGGKIAELENSAAVLCGQLEELAARIENLALEQAALDDEPAGEALQQALAVRQEKEKALAAARDVLAGAANALQRLEEQRMASEHKLHPLRDRLEQARLKEQEARLYDEQCAEQLAVAGADEAVLAPLLDRNASQSGLQGEIGRLEQEIEALGAVNLAALDELTSGRERKQYLDAQAADLASAMDTLEQAIRRIDRETRARLQETFDTVNRHFGELFPSVFGGGQARLELAGEEILDAGVTLIAQPPGKRNSSIHLLSGGEKALTALALVFSLFQLNPAPFCMLDEVDAPLDDTNTERFCELVKKMSAHTQFVFVSHNKITMEMAQQLVGVTMQESGVSRVVAVDLEEAVRMRDEAA